MKVLELLRLLAKADPHADVVFLDSPDGPDLTLVSIYSDDHCGECDGCLNNAGDVCEESDKIFIDIEPIEEEKPNAAKRRTKSKSR